MTQDLHIRACNRSYFL